MSSKSGFFLKSFPDLLRTKIIAAAMTANAHTIIIAGIAPPDRPK